MSRAPVFWFTGLSGAGKTTLANGVKGLYAKATRGEIADLIGFSPGGVYQPPTAPDPTLVTDGEGAAISIDRRYRFIRRHLGVAAKLAP